MDKHNCTRKVEQFRMFMTDDEVCKKIGISKPTLYKRLRDSKSWKTAEIYVIENWKL